MHPAEMVKQSRVLRRVPFAPASLRTRSTHPKHQPGRVAPRTSTSSTASSSVSVVRDLGLITSFTDDRPNPNPLHSSNLPAGQTRTLARARRRQKKHGENPQPRQRTTGEKTILERYAIKDTTRLQYNVYLQAFTTFASARDLPLTTADQVDLALVEYYDYTFLLGSQSDTADKTIAAWMNAYPQFGKHGHLRLPREARARQGFHRLAPGCSRAPLAIMIVAALAMAVAAGRSPAAREMALAIILSFSAYLRPGELLRLRPSDVVPPTGPKGSPLDVTAIIISPIERLEPSKTNTYDDTILLDSIDFPNLGSMINDLARRRASHFFLFGDFKSDELRTAFENASQLLKLPPLVLYQLRHGGASHDLLYRRREMEAIKQRGRWRTDASLRRYAKQGKVQSMVANLTNEVRVYADYSMQNIENVLLLKQPPRPLLQ